MRDTARSDPEMCWGMRRRLEPFWWGTGFGWGSGDARGVGRERGGEGGAVGDEGTFRERSVTVRSHSATDGSS
ncbi:hypothetical protein GCM10010400_66530 [Streptomyces aculeolatus]